MRTALTRRPCNRHHVGLGQGLSQLIPMRNEDQNYNHICDMPLLPLHTACAHPVISIDLCAPSNLLQCRDFRKIWRVFQGNTVNLEEVSPKNSTMLSSNVFFSEVVPSIPTQLKCYMRSAKT